MPLKIYISSDHGGLEDKAALVEWLQNAGNAPDVEVVDLGPKRLKPDDDYPEYAQELCKKLLVDLHSGIDSRGVLICRGGQGMAMAANRFKHIRASVVWDDKEAEMTRLDNDSNVLSLAADRLDLQQMKRIFTTWVGTDFSGARRHRRRILMLDQFDA